MRRLLYLHGFRSSPSSAKAVRLANSVGQRPDVLWQAPQLAASPEIAMQQALALFADASEDDLVIGSSLGGFYASRLASRLGCRALCINPATYPSRDLRAWIGQHPVWQGGGTIDFTEQHVQELVQLESWALPGQARHITLVAATGDEILDWREMVAGLPSAEVIQIDGGDHGLADWPELEQTVLRCALLSVA